MSEDTQMASIIIGDSTALRIFTTMLEKHEKGTIATKNTVEAFGGDSHAMDAVLGHIAHWRRQTALQGELLAPKGDGAAAGTPLGEALSRAESDGENASSFRWRDWVPYPRPSVGQFVRWPGGNATSIVKAIGFYHPELEGDEQGVSAELYERLQAEGAFEVEDAEGWRGYVQSHVEPDALSIEWRVRSDDYDTERVMPSSMADLAVERVIEREGASSESDVLDDYSTGTSQEAEEEGTPATRAAAAADAALDAKARELGWKSWDAMPADAKPDERASSYAMRKSAGKGKGGSKQRARNAAQAGVTRPAPKPGAKKGASRKGGR